MPSERKAKFLEQECLKAANRAIAKSGTLTEDQLRGLRVQTCSPFERGFVLLCGLGLAGLGLWFRFKKDEPIGFAICGVAALLCIFVAVAGRKSDVSSVFRILDAQVTTRILDGLF